MRLSQKVFWIFFSITLVTLILALNQFVTYYAQKKYNSSIEQVNLLQSQVRQLDQLHLALFQPDNKFDQIKFDKLLEESSATSSRLRSEMVNMPSPLLEKLAAMDFNLNNFATALYELAESRDAILQLEATIHGIMRNLHLHEELPVAHKNAHRSGKIHSHDAAEDFRSVADLQLHFQISSYVHHKNYHLLPDLKKTVERLSADTTNESLAAELRHLIQLVEKYYRRDLQLADRKKFVEAAAENFIIVTRQMLGELKKINTERQKLISQVSLLVSFVGVLAAVFYWYRIRVYIRRFLHNQNQVMRALQSEGVETMTLVPQSRDELGKLTATLKEVSVELQAKKEALLDSEQKYRSLVENLNEWIWETNVNHRFSYCSQAGETITGFSQAKVLGRKYLALSKECEDREILEQIEDHFREHRPFANIERKIVCADGSIKHLIASGTPIYDTNEMFVGFRGIDRDITVLVNAREAHDQLEAKLQHAQKMESIGRLAGGVAHDFNNILSAIIGYTELAMLRLEKDHKCYKYIGEIRNSGERAAGLTKQLLAFSRKQARTPQNLDIGREVHKLEDMMRRLVGEQIALQLEEVDDTWPVLMDKSQLEQVVVNLVVNAKDAMVDGGELKIRLRNCRLDCSCRKAENLGLPDIEYVELTVSDTGSGMSKEVLQNIFDPFFTTKEKDKGTGLGLAMVYGIVNQNNGEVLVDSEVGRGSSFRVLLPRSIQEPVASAAEDKAEAVRKGSETILFVEDEAPLREMHANYLASLGYRVFTAADGVEGVEVFERERGIDLLVTDVVMPRMGGIELAEKLTTADPQLKVLYSSGYANQELFEDGGLQEGVNFIYKPATPIDLVSMMKKILD